MPIPQNGQIHSNNLSAICQPIVWVWLTILWNWRLKGEMKWKNAWKVCKTNNVSYLSSLKSRWWPSFFFSFHCFHNSDYHFSCSFCSLEWNCLWSFLQVCLPKCASSLIWSLAELHFGSFVVFRLKWVFPILYFSLSD